MDEIEYLTIIENLTENLSNTSGLRTQFTPGANIRTTKTFSNQIQLIILKTQTKLTSMVFQTTPFSLRGTTTANTRQPELSVMSQKKVLFLSTPQTMKGISLFQREQGMARKILMEVGFPNYSSSKV